MTDVVRYEVRNRVAVLTIDNPPVNALSPAVWSALEAAVARGAGDADADALVLIGAGQTFVAGSDIGAFNLLKTRDQSLARSERRHGVLERFEDVAKPFVAAIHGNAFGGGLELAMSCHYRVATGNAKIGQPEVLLGLIPGAGGSQRLPRLCGTEMALEMCATGQAVTAAAAHAAGIVDRIAAGNLLDEAIAFATERVIAAERRKTRDIGIAPDRVSAGLAACQSTRSKLPWPTRGGKAAHAAVDAIEAWLTSPTFQAGSLRERELFADCVLSTESKALRHLFFADREAMKIPGISKDTATREVRAAAIIGAGTMGAGIAMAFASAGIPVLLKDLDTESLDKGRAVIRRSYEASIAKGKLTRDAGERAMALIAPTTTFDGFDAVDVVVEAVFEDMALKTATFAKLARATRPDCILATNTSTLDIDEMARTSGRPAQVVGHHYFSPANVMKLLEIVRGRETSQEVLAASIRLAKRLQKVPVVVGNGFGFVANRMLAYYMREAYLLLEEGASVSQIDRTVTDFGFSAGPFQMQDIAGIDVGARIRQHLQRLGRTRADGPQSAVPDRLYEMGRYGQKTGAGWYLYAPGSRVGTPDPVVEQIAEEEAARRGIRRRSVADEEILARVTTALANEGARVLEDGLALRAGDIDVIYTYGFGFPRYRGGPLFYADTLGLPVVADRVREYRDRFGDYWKLSPLLERLARENRGFYSEPEPVVAT